VEKGRKKWYTKRIRKRRNRGTFMRRRAGKRAAALVCAAMMLPGLISCGDTAETGAGEQNGTQATEEAGGSAPAWERYADEEITLDWYVNYSWFATPWGENLVSKTITEETGVNINFITPIGNETEKLNALIASDTLPDIITIGWWEPQVNEVVTNDMVYPLNELADAYDPYFWEVSDPAAVNWYTQEDGNIYAYPNSSVTPQDVEENEMLSSNETFLVRGDIYEAIGSPDMTTPEGFAAAVKMAAEQFPEVEGGALIPVGAHVFDNEGNVSFDKYLMNFLAIPWEKDGVYYDRYTDPNIYAGLRCSASWARKGIWRTIYSWTPEPRWRRRSARADILYAVSVQRYDFPAEDALRQRP